MLVRVAREEKGKEIIVLTKGRHADSAFEDVKVQSGFVPIVLGKMGQPVDNNFHDHKNDVLRVRHQFKHEIGRVPNHDGRKADLDIELRWWK